jgi:hypothetical protein
MASEVTNNAAPALTPAQELTLEQARTERITAERDLLPQG